jgi:restriction system protein
MELTEPMIITIILGLIMIYFITKYALKEEAKSKAEKNKNDQEVKESYKKTRTKAFAIINKNKKQLAIQRKKSIATDDYGKENLSKWLDVEIPYFIDNHIYPKLAQYQIPYLNEMIFEIINKVDSVAKNYKLKNYGYNEKMDGFEFEIFCAEKLENEGWLVKKTKNGADQGVDLIIEKGTRKIAVQCKKYARPIGNKAVQEVKSGIEHYHLNEGIVLVNNSFTKSAKELAKSNNIGLFHYLETEKI